MCWYVCITPALIICVDYVFCNVFLELSSSRNSDLYHVLFFCN